MMLTILTKTKVKLTCSCLEIYNDEIRDLLWRSSGVVYTLNRLFKEYRAHLLGFLRHTMLTQC